MADERLESTTIGADVVWRDRTASDPPIAVRHFIVTTMGLKPSPSGESFRFLIGR